MDITASDRSALIRLASSLPVGDESRRAILSGLRTAGAFSSKDALKKYLSEHPEADKSKHWVATSTHHSSKSKEHYEKAQAHRRDGDNEGADLHQQAAAYHSGTAEEIKSLTKLRKTRGEDHPETLAKRKRIEEGSDRSTELSEKANTHSKKGK